MNKKRFPEPVEALLLILAIFFGLIGLILILSGLFGITLDPTQMEKRLRYFYVFGGVLFFIVPFLYARLKEYDASALFRLKKVPPPVLLFSVVGGLSLTILSDELDRLVNLIFPIPEWLLEQMQPLQAQGMFDWFIIIIGAVIVASFAEEALFRGFFQVTLEQKGDVTRAVLLSALGWTIIHMNPYWSVQIFVLGVFIGYLAWRSDSIIPPMIVHGTNNLVALLFLNFTLQHHMDWYLWKGHVSPPILVVAAGGLLWSFRNISLHYRANP